MGWAHEKRRILPGSLPIHHTGSRGSVKVEETRRMSDLLCVPCRPEWQVGISERRNLCRPGGASPFDAPKVMFLVGRPKLN